MSYASPSFAVQLIACALELRWPYARLTAGAEADELIDYKLKDPSNRRARLGGRPAELFTQGGPCHAVR